MSGRTRAVLQGERLEAREVPTAAPIFAVGAGPGGGPRVQVFDTSTGIKLADFFAYEPSFTGGVTTAVADVDSDGRPDVIVGAGNGGAPRIRVFDGRAFVPFLTSGNVGFGTTPPVIADFFAYEPTFRNGVNVAAGNIVGVSFAEVVAGAGPGGGPRVRVFDGQRITAAGSSFNGTVLGDVVADYFAYDSSIRSGVRVAVTTQLPLSSFPGDVVTAPGPGVVPEIRLFSGVGIAAQRTNFTGRLQGDILNDFLDGSDTAGRFVAAADYSKDGIADIATGTGPGVTTRVTIYNGASLRTGGLNFTGRGVGDVFDTFVPVSDQAYQSGVTVGGAVLQVGLGANLLYGIGGSGRVGETIGVQYTPSAVGTSRTVVFDQFFDPRSSAASSWGRSGLHRQPGID